MDPQHSETFIGQTKDEVVIQCLHRHWIVFISQIIMLLLLSAATALILYWLFRSQSFGTLNKTLWIWILTATAIVSNIFLHQILGKVFGNLMYIVIITNYRIITVHKNILTEDEQEVVDLAAIQNISSAKQGLLQNILGFGNVKIILSATNVVRTIKAVVRPNEIVQLIGKARKRFLQEQGSQNQPI